MAFFDVYENKKMSFEAKQQEIINFLKSRYSSCGDIETKIKNLDFHISKNQNSTHPLHIFYEPSICVILQGKKEVVFGDKSYTYDNKEYLISSTHLPATVRIVDNFDEYFSFRLKFSLEDIYEVLKNVDIKEQNSKTKSQVGLFFGKLDNELFDAFYRLIMLLQKDNQNIDYLSSLIKKEILYLLLNGEASHFLKKFAQNNSISNKITKVITNIKENFAEKLNIEELALSVGISPSSLYQNFKTVTKMSPIQYQKNLRLQEAKQLLTIKNIPITQVAYTVGYESASQFSKDYSLMFKVSPREHANILKN